MIQLIHCHSQHIPCNESNQEARTLSFDESHTKSLCLCYRFLCTFQLPFGLICSFRVFCPFHPSNKKHHIKLIIYFLLKYKQFVRNVFPLNASHTLEWWIYRAILNNMYQWQPDNVSYQKSPNFTHCKPPKSPIASSIVPTTPLPYLSNQKSYFVTHRDSH